MRKKLLSPLIILLLTLSLLSGLSVSMTMVSAAEYPSIYVDPPVLNSTTTPPAPLPYGTFTVSIKTDYTGNDITAFQFTLSFNPDVLNITSVDNEDLITEGRIWRSDCGRNEAAGVFIEGGYSNDDGYLNLTVGYYELLHDLEPMEVVEGPKTLASVTFKVVDVGDSPITLGSETKLIGYTNVDWDWCPACGKEELWGGWGDFYTITDGGMYPERLGHGYFTNAEAPVRHDVAVLSVTPDSPSVVKGDPLNIKVEVKNKGTVTETFDVSAYYDIHGVIGAPQPVENLSPDDTDTLTFEWDTSKVMSGSHIISAVAEILPNEFNTDDNTLIDGTVEVQIPIWADISAETPSIANYHEDILFDASGSDSLRGDIDTYMWDFGDEYNETAGGDEGEPIIHLTSEPIICHRYAQPGVYAVLLRVNDTTGELSDPVKHTIEIIYPYLASLVKWQVKPEAHNWVYKNREGGDTWTGDGVDTTFTTTIKPIVEDSEEVYVQLTEMWPADGTFTTTVTPIDYLTIEQTTLDYTEEVYVNFTDTWEGNGEKTKFSTTRWQILPGSEKVYVNGHRVYREADYTIMYTQGRIEFITPEPGAPGVGAEITAIYTVLMWRDHDYTIDYTKGKITFITPLESQAEVVRVVYMGNVTGREDIYGYSIDYAAGNITFKTVPEKGAEIAAKYEYDVIVITALARNWGSKPMDVKVTFEFYDRDGEKVGPTIPEELTLKVPYEDVEIIVCVDPSDLVFDGSRKVTRYIQVTLEYYDPTTKEWIPTSTKIVGIRIVP